MRKTFLLVVLSYMLVSCASPSIEPKIDFSEDEVLLNKIKNKYKKVDSVDNENNSLYSKKSIDLLSDYEVDLNVGDVIFIDIDENVSRNSVGRKETSTANSMSVAPMSVTQPNAEHKITSKAIGTLQPLLNLGIESDNSSSFKGVANATNVESFKTSINALITKQVSKDLFYIEARKTILLNNEKQNIKVTGYIHKNDIDNRFRINSNKVIELKVYYGGEGSSEDATNSSYIGRVLDKIFF